MVASQAVRCERVQQGGIDQGNGVARVQPVWVEEGVDAGQTAGLLQNMATNVGVVSGALSGFATNC